MSHPKVKKTAGLRIEALEARRLLAADPIISEFLASNRNGITDANGASSDWIEIYNAGDEAVDLVDYSLTDDPSNARKWVFPNQSLNPGQFVLVFASGDGVPDAAGALHTNFKLSADGEYIALHDPNGTVLSEFGPDGSDFPEQNADVSFGVGFNTSSTEAINANSTSRYLIPNNGNVDGTWRSIAFNDASWTAGTAALGYENSPGSSTSYSSLIGTNLPSGTTTAYVRIPFDVTNQSTFLGELGLRYDDGFVAYINGQEVARSNAPGSLTYQSVATTENPDNLARNEQILSLIHI